MVEEINKILEFLREKEIGQIASYDIKDWWMKDEAEDPNHIKKFVRYRNTNDGHDCDVELLSLVVYYLVFLADKNNWEITHQSGTNNKYCLVNRNDVQSNWELRGDTMNSCVTTLNLLPGRMKVTVKKDTFEEDISRIGNNLKEILTDSGIELLSKYHTIGNLIPVPFVSRWEGQFNCPRGTGKSKDYWDLALLAFYKHYHPEIDEFSYMKEPLQWLLGNEQNVHLCRKWLDSFDAKNGQTRWDAFVEQNFMQDFVNQQNGHFDLPKELWIGHFKKDVPVLPNENDFDQFFTNASAWIVARGIRIAIKIKNELEGKDLATLANKMVCG